MTVFPAVFLSKEAEIEFALVDFIQVDGIGTTVGRRDIPLEQEWLEEASQQRVAGKVFTKSLALYGEFLLHAADEDPHTPSCFRISLRALSVSRASASMTFSSSTISAIVR